MVTLMFELTEVVGAAGTLGTAEALIATSVESAPRPTRLRAVTLNKYTTSAVSEVAVYDYETTPEASTVYAPYSVL